MRIPAPMDQKLDIVTIGDSTIDTFIKVHDASVECDINHQECKICVTYGDKIPVDAIGSSVAGNAANVAVSCARLDMKTAIYTNLGNDEAGERIKKTLESEKIASDFIIVNKNRSSNLSVILTFQGERTAFVYHQPWDYLLPNLTPASWIYLTSLAESFTNSNLMDEVCHYLDKTRAKLAFSPGTFQIKANVKRYPRILEKSQVLVANVEEAKKILAVDPHQVSDVKDLLSKLFLLGPKIIIITDGAEGSYAYDGQKFLRLASLHVEVVEKTGAGDSYTGALLTALVLGKSLEEAMIWGTVNAASVIQKLGPQEGLLARDHLLNQIKNRSLVVTGF